MRLIKKLLVGIGHALGFPADTLPVRFIAWTELRIECARQALFDKKN